jgi:uracil-DNA glycosylase
LQHSTRQWPIDNDDVRLDYTDLPGLLDEIRSCRLCVANLPLGPRPIVQLDPAAQILIVGQAPGRKVHQSGIPFNDASGDRLRNWMGIDSEVFYNPQSVALLPMGFCFPGSGPSGDLPPRPECARKWRQRVLDQLGNVTLTLVIGQHAQRYHLPASAATVTEVVAAWRDHWPAVVPLPHPSPRNNMWIRKNPWFEEDLVPALRELVHGVLPSSGTSSSWN